MLTPQRQLELLESFVRSEAWTEFLQPSFQNMHDMLINQAKNEQDSYKVAKILGQALGADVVLELPKLKDILQQQLKEESVE